MRIPILTEFFDVDTRGFTHILDVTPQVREKVKKSGFIEGQALVFVSGSTAAITTIEFEPGLLQDIPEALERLAPEDGSYHHDATWGDGNGSAHVRAALLGASFTAPFSQGDLLLGTWQQIVLVDFDNRPRHRRIVVQITGE